MNIGFIGVGNMGKAILNGMLLSDGERENNYYICGRDLSKTIDIAKTLHVNFFDGIVPLVECCDIIFLGVKPDKMETILPIVKEKYTDEKILISMAAGVTIRQIESFVGEKSKIIRIMPNTPIMVGEGMTSVSKNKNITDEETLLIMEIFKGFGKAIEVDEELIHSVIGASGSSPAYTYMYINGLVQAAEKNGIRKDKARIFVAQAVLGAAKMVLNSDEDLDLLIDSVCSKGGTTIEAVNLIKKSNFNRILGDAFQAAVDKSISMSEDKDDI